MRRLAALLLAAWLAPAAPAALPIDHAMPIASFPHDPGAFTEGLFYKDGRFYESTGLVGRSTIRLVDPETGVVRRSVTVPPPDFGEGIVAWGKQLISLTWRGGVGYRWTLDGFRKLGQWHYPGEGWALTSDGRHLIMSDGTATLRLLDPKTLRETGRIAVTAEGAPLSQLNELEYVDGEILANIWLTDMIARIDPATGHVVGWIDVSGLRARAHAADPDAVPNGIAWDKARRRLFVTGKNWPLLFQIAPPKG
ncbi:glutaminyl-peptide cyclotransferase [Sphingomonas morindae]|uniref:Glutaminyl-peptide cyclotransferase n=1 Tax=Sphingomonas morindae TaxID=1541170 RepID=A0ABY4XBK8_9SPHN|nr:glutaminyl-peptide cyclotransferase [Sphingomonas morindae]USI74341.1 glutaminyl-peptide cyclotransferase [Sphingomonas morindae]